MKRLKILREERGMSQQRLAIELNIAQATVSKYELDICEPDIAMIRQIVQLFGVSTDYLLDISDDKISVSAYGLSNDEKYLLFGFKRLDNFQKAKLQAYLQGLLQE
ncbi:MAG: helix-turn-helix transcriptional regulator [Oscillospiraceae bacterium]|nr:helix-turn-helix transcriptional regulator [Oscillospiraceae bacterium]